MEIFALVEKIKQPAVSENFSREVTTHSSMLHKS